MTNRWFNAEGHSKGPKTRKNSNKKLTSCNTGSGE